MLKRNALRTSRELCSVCVCLYACRLLCVVSYNASVYIDPYHEKSSRPAFVVALSSSQILLYHRVENFYNIRVMQNRERQLKSIVECRNKKLRVKRPSGTWVQMHLLRLCSSRCSILFCKYAQSQISRATSRQ